LAAGGEKKTLRLAATYASIWHGSGDLETLARKQSVLAGWCQEIGRDPGEIERSTTTRADDSDAQRDALVKSGITHLILGLQHPWDFAAVERLARWRDSRQHAFAEERSF
jgi:hypothetical protein